MPSLDLAVARTSAAAYPSAAPYDPATRYPEYPAAAEVSSESNEVYAAVRETLRLAELDPEHFGTPEWNPLGRWVKPGQTVMLKPNLVKEAHPRDPEGWRYVITHGSIIRAVADYVAIALRGSGKIVVADAPQTDSRFKKMAELLGLHEIAAAFAARGVTFEIVDLRKEEWDNVDEVIVARHQLPGDPEGYIAYDLADRSEFAKHHGGGRYYGADYDDDTLNSHHTGGKHEYLLSRSSITCDVFINLPKLKTHKKAGITVNLKNLVGVNGDKNWLPHHTVGTPRDGGDQFPNQSWKTRLEHRGAQTLRKLALAMPGVGTWLLKRARKAGKKVFGDGDQTIRSGNWHGNDTTWRMVLDLNKLVLYGNPNGTMREPKIEAQKPYLCFVDGILGGQGNGPMDPDPLESRCVLFGDNPAAVDAACAVLMGFEVEKIPIVRQAFAAVGFPLTAGTWQEVNVRCDHMPWQGKLGDLQHQRGMLAARPHHGWRGGVESLVNNSSL